MNEIDILGYSSTFIFIILFLPQIYKTTKSKSTNDLSFIFLFFNLVASILMISYSYLLSLVPILISNSVIAFSNIYLIFFKYKYDTKIIKKDKGTNTNNIKPKKVKIRTTTL